MGQPDEQQRRLAQITATLDELMTGVQHEHDRRQAAGENAEWLQQTLAELEPVREQAQNLEIVHAIRNIVQRHGPGPYPPEDLAVMLGLDDVATVRRVLEEMATGGLAERDEQRG